MSRAKVWLAGSAATVVVLSYGALAQETTTYSYDGLGRLNGSTITGLAFGHAYRWLPGSNGAIKGLIYGVVGWAIMGLVFFPMIGLGFFGVQAGLGISPALFSLAMLLTYSVILGMVYDALN